jgi:heme-degrading monooxygenase HmoA
MTPRPFAIGVAIAIVSSLLDKNRYGSPRMRRKDMKNPALVLLVRLKSSLSLDEVNRVVEERAPEFRALAGLQQKYYLHDTNTGEFAGLYLWESGECLESYRHSELRASIAKAYKTEGEPRIEVYRVFKTLREEGS